MTYTEKIKQAMERQEKALSLRPAIGQGTYVSKARLRDGLTCEVEEGAWHLIIDGSPLIGDKGTAPTPGVLGRAALGSCLVVGYVMWAAKLGVPLTAVEVEVHADSDERGFYGLEDVRGGYVEIRYSVNIESTAPEAEIHRMLDVADMRSPWLNNISRPLSVKRHVQIKNTEKILQAEI